MQRTLVLLLFLVLFCSGLFAQGRQSTPNLLTLSQCDPLTCFTQLYLSPGEPGRTSVSVTAACIYTPSYPASRDDGGRANDHISGMQVFAGIETLTGCSVSADVWARGKSDFLVFPSIRGHEEVGIISAVAGGAPTFWPGNDYIVMIDEKRCDGEEYYQFPSGLPC